MSRLPERVSDLRELDSDEARVCYSPAQDGEGFVLSRACLKLYEEHLADIAEIEAAHDASMAQERARLERAEAQHAQLILDAAVRQALEAAGARLDRIELAEALFRSQTPLRVEEGTLMVDVPGTFSSVGFAAAAWLDSPAGAPYRAARPARDDDGGSGFAHRLRLVGQRQ